MDPTLISYGPNSDWDTHISSGTNDGWCTQWNLLTWTYASIKIYCNCYLNHSRAIGSCPHLRDPHLVVLCRLHTHYLGHLQNILLLSSHSLFFGLLPPSFLIVFFFSFISHLFGTSSTGISSMINNIVNRLKCISYIVSQSADNSIYMPARSRA